jgi:hypothetical protein
MKSARESTLGYATVLLGAVLVATAPLWVGNDGLDRYRILDAFLRYGVLEGGKYSLYGPLAASPLWFLGNAAGNSLPTVWLFNRLIFLTGLAGLWPALSTRLSTTVLLRFAVLLLFASMFPWHVTGFYAEVFHTVCVGFGLALLVLYSGPRAWLGGGLAVWGTANVPATVVGLGLAAAGLCWHGRCLRYLSLPIAAGLLIVVENWVRRGSPLAGGYEGDAGHHTVLPFSGRSGFSYPLFFGLLSILFSFGKGLVFFIPGLFLALPAPASQSSVKNEGAVRLLYRTWLAVVIGQVLVYSQWWSWYGGATWGPRFFLFAGLPAALVLARRSAQPETHSAGANLAVLLALALSCWVGASGLVYDEYDHDQFHANNYALEYLTWYVPECSVLWRPFVVLKPLSPLEWGKLAAFALAFLYLAAPVMKMLAAQLRDRLGSAWRSARAGQWRF